MSKLNDALIARVMQAYVDNISDSNLEGIIALFAENAVVEDPVGSEPVRGHEALRGFYTMACESVSKMVLEGNVRSCGSWGACAMLATPKGAEGALVIETLDVMQFNDDGKIIAMQAYWGDSNMKTL